MYRHFPAKERQVGHASRQLVLMSDAPLPPWLNRFLGRMKEKAKRFGAPRTLVTSEIGSLIDSLEHIATKEVSDEIKLALLRGLLYTTLAELTTDDEVRRVLRGEYTKPLFSRDDDWDWDDETVIDLGGNCNIE